MEIGETRNYCSITLTAAIRGASATRQKEKRERKKVGRAYNRDVAARADVLCRCGKPDGIGETACSISHGRDDDSERRAGFRGATLSIRYRAESNP